MAGYGGSLAKNVFDLRSQKGDFAIAPVYDVPCPLLEDDNALALSAATSARLDELPFSGGVLRGAQRELRSAVRRLRLELPGLTHGPASSRGRRDSWRARMRVVMVVSVPSFLFARS